MNPFTHRVVVAAILVLLGGSVCLSLSAQQSTTSTDSNQSASPAAQPPAPAAVTQDSAGTQQPSSPPGNAQPAQRNGAGFGSGFTIQRNVRLVVLDMVVTDAKGNVVNNLTQGDFHVEEAGQPQEILHFDPAGAHTIDPQVTIDSTADLDRLAPRAPVNIILLDEFNTRFEDMAFARYSLKKYLEAQPAKLPTPTILIAVNLQQFHRLAGLHTETRMR